MKVTCFGEILWDIYPEGKQLGGAPFNVAAHLNQLGTTSHIISKIGSDELGEEILNRVKFKKIQTNFIQKDEDEKTGVVTVSLDSKGIPSYDIKQPSAWDNIMLDASNQELVSTGNALVYGSLASRSKESRKTLMKLLELSPLNICDLNIRLAYYSPELITDLLHNTDILKINDDEAALLVTLLDLPEAKLYEHLEQTYSIRVIIKTLGKDGAEVYSRGVITRGTAIEITVVDTVGSGDAFLAAFIHHYLKNDSMQVCIDAACRLGAYVATQAGAIPKHSSKGLSPL